LFISLDGIDGTGKSTQCRLLVDCLLSRGLAVVSCVDPGGTPLGQSLREILLHHRQEMSSLTEALLFMASRAQLVASVIRPALEAGQVVVSDRYLLANVVYQGHGRGLDVEQLWQVGRFAAGNLEPNLTLVLDLPVEAALRRRERPADRIESRDQAEQERVRQGFLTEARRRPERIRVIDARGSLAEVQLQIQKEVASVLATPSRA
jgi:dTMP kinase